MPVPTTRPNFITFDKDFWGNGEILPPPPPQTKYGVQKTPDVKA